MNAAEIEIRHGQRNRVNEIIHLPREARRQAGKSLVEMTQRAVQPFSMAGGDVCGIGMAANHAGFNFNAFAEAVTVDAVFFVPLITVESLYLYGVMRLMAAIVQNATDEAAPAIG